MLDSQQESMFFEVREESDMISPQLGKRLDTEIRRSMPKLFSTGYYGGIRIGYRVYQNKTVQRGIQDYSLHFFTTRAAF